MFLGSWATASNKEALKQLRITHIVNATDVCDMPFQDDFEVRHCGWKRQEPSRAPALSPRALLFQYLQCPLDDRPEHSIGAFFTQFMSFVDTARQNNGRLLVHCKMGMRYGSGGDGATAAARTALPSLSSPAS